MLPEVRALADKLAYDVAMLKYVATGLPKGGLERTVPGGWTVRQVLAHLAASEVMCVEALDRLLAGEPPVPPDFDPDRINAEAAQRHSEARLPDVLGALADARDAMISRFEQLTAVQLGSPFGRVPSLRTVLVAWSGHCEEHALDLVDVLPSLRVDPMVLNWVLHADYTDRPERNARQGRLFAEVREQLDREDREGSVDEDEFEDEEND
jgi:hypothetical protein